MNARIYSFAFVFIASLACIVAHYLTGHSIRPILVNSDALYLPTLFADLLSKNGSIKDWYLTPAPYFFPDFPIFLVSYLAGSGPYSQIAVYSILQTILAFTAIWFLARQILKSNAFIAAITISILLIWLALTSGEPFALMLVSAHHYGIFLTAIVFVGLWLRLINQPAKHTKTFDYCMLAVLTFLSSLSDTLFVSQVIVPIVAIAILSIFTDRTSLPKNTLLLLIAPVFGMLGSRSYEYIVENDTRYLVDIGPDKLAANLNAIYEILIPAAANNPIFAAMFLLYTGIVIHSFFQLKKKMTSHNSLPWLVVFSLLSFFSTIATVSLVTNLPITPRYFISSLSWPVIVIVIFAASTLQRRFFFIALISSLLATVSLSSTSYSLIQTNGFNTHYYPDEISCIDDTLEEADAFNGIAQYWDAKHLQNFSQLDLNIAQHLDNLSEMKWITSQKYFRENYDFAIISDDANPPFKLSSERLAQLNGIPAAVKTCGSKTIFLYGNDKLHVRKAVNVGDSYTWKGCELFTKIGETTAECEMQKKDVSQSGYLTFGPYEQLPSGRYAFEIVYSSSAGKTDTAGDWDVALALPTKAIPLVKGLLAGTGGAIDKTSGEFDIAPQQNLEKIEIRTLARKKIDLKIIHIRVTRLQ